MTETMQVPEDKPNNPQTTSTDFGESNYGERLVYHEHGCCEGWRDRGWAFFYYLHITLMIVLAIALPITSGGISSDNNNTPAPTWYIDNGDGWNFDTFPVTGIIITILIQCVIGSIFGLIWLKIMQTFASIIIKTMLFVVLLMWIAVIVFGFYIGNDNGGMNLVIIGAIMFLLNGLYTYCIWARIPFSSALLTIASAITQTFEGTICISLLVIPMSLFWYGIWVMVLVGTILHWVNGTVPGSGIVFGVIFLLLISLYWGLAVNKNVSHTTTCGVTATWFFSSQVHKPTMPALNRTLTTSFGSVCFGSFIVGVLSALRAFARAFRNNTLCCCIARCLLYCLDNLIRYFNMYAFAQVAIYGHDYITAAKQTWGLLMSKGLEAVINDDLTGLALFCGWVLSGVLSFFTGWLIIPLFYKKSDYDDDQVKAFQISVGCVGCILAGMLCVTILQVVRSSIVALFVCFAEDPASMEQNRPKEFNMLIDSKNALRQLSQTGHTGLGENNKQGLL